MLVRDKMQWHAEADIVVVGYGLAGCAAAISAAEAGADVIVLEKQAVEGRVTNSAMAGGVFINPTDVPVAAAHLEQLYREGDISWTDSATIRAWVEYSHENVKWLEGLGGVIKQVNRQGEHAEIPGHETIQAYSIRGMGWGMMDLVEKRVREKGCRVSYETRANRLISDPTGRVQGVRTQKDGQEFNIKGRAVVLATGGFEFDEEMKLNYLRTYPTHFTGSPANTGDGVRMAQDAGASLWHMNCVSGGMVVKYPEIPAAFRIDAAARFKLHESNSSPDVCGYVIVDRHGRRFFNETISFLKMHGFYYEFIAYDAERRQFPRIPSYVIIDQRRIKEGPLPGLYAPIIRHWWGYAWSSESKEEVAKGWVKKADTVRELAGKLELDPDTLDRTVRTYNEYCARGEDPDFHRGAQYLVSLNEPPFYGVRVGPGGPNTQGGPRRNHKAQILNPDGEPIPGLYGAGELGAIFGMFYPTGGGNLAEAIAFGRIAGENSAREVLSR